jgi:hypothetical protein
MFFQLAFEAALVFVEYIDLSLIGFNLISIRNTLSRRHLRQFPERYYLAYFSPRSAEIFFKSIAQFSAPVIQNI